MVIELCKEKGCTGKLVSKGLCDKHRKRLARHGHTKQTRAYGSGQMQNHPLYNTWNWMKRLHLKDGDMGDWVVFEKFVSDVRERPSELHVLKRIDLTKPFSNDNCKWCLKSKIPTNPEEYRKQKAEYAKEYRLKHPRKSKSQDLMSSYGITLDDYEAILKAQNNVCAICGNDEQAKTNSGKVRALAVDHCHTTGKVRGLLCTNCNKGIGHFRDDVTLLTQAIAYLNN